VAVALITQETKSMSHLILSSVACELYSIFQHYLINSIIFEEKLMNPKCALIFSTTLSQTLLILRLIQLDVIIKVH
jgi:hypothetical protein